MKRAGDPSGSRITARSLLATLMAVSTMLHADEVVDQSELEGLPAAEAKPQAASQAIDAGGEQRRIGRFVRDAFTFPQLEQLRDSFATPNPNP